MAAAVKEGAADLTSKSSRPTAIRSRMVSEKRVQKKKGKVCRGEEKVRKVNV